jgi:drug/metabolite transporter (DMT)-like permease
VKQGANKARVYTALIITLIFWASAFVGIRYGVKYCSPLSMALFRFIVASVVLAIYALVKGMRLPDKKDVPLFLLTGFVGITIYHISLNIGEVNVRAGTASFIISSVPVLTGIFSIIFFKEYLKFWGWVGLCISFIGIALISFSESGFGSINWGTLLVFIAALSGSGYVIFQKKLLQKYTSIEVTTYTIWAGTLFMLFFMPQLIRDLPNMKAPVILDIIYLGICPAAIAYFLWTYTLNNFTSATHTTTFLYFSPILTTLIGFVLISEIPDFYTILGGFIILGGVVLANTMGRK